jgi:hypothetical protein
MKFSYADIELIAKFLDQGIAGFEAILQAGVNDAQAVAAFLKMEGTDRVVTQEEFEDNVLVTIGDIKMLRQKIKDYYGV